MAEESSRDPKGSTLQFVSFTNPSDCHASEVKHAIRSHVTRYQHRHRRPKSPESGKEKKPKSSKSRQESPVATSERRGDQDSSNRGSPRTPAELAPYSRLLGATLFRSNGNEFDGTDLSSEKSSAITPVWNPDFTEGFSMKGMYIDTRQILDNLSPAFNGEHSFSWDYTSQEANQGLFHTLTAEDPAPYSAAVLLAASHISQLCERDSQCSEVLRLREAAMENLQQAVRTSRGQIGDSLIITVALLAVYEKLYGQEEFFTVHMRGLADMFQLRGGIKQSGMVGILSKLILSFDDELDCADLLSRMPPLDAGYFGDFEYS